jgi:hypothetical protein
VILRSIDKCTVKAVMPEGAGIDFAVEDEAPA